jgi:Protein of unknown function (DUF2384)
VSDHVTDCHAQVARPLPDLSDPVARARLALGLPAVLRILARWEVPRRAQATLLGLSRRTLQRAAAGHVPRLSADQVTRMSLIVGIYTALHSLQGAAVADGWLTRANNRVPFNGRPPLEYLQRESLPGLWAVRRMLEADRQGYGGVPHGVHVAQPPLDLPEPAAPQM